MTQDATPYLRFQQQRSSAKKRGKEWLLSFDQWMAIWDESGHFAERGRKVGQYVMARHGDVGPYAVGNVSIVMTSENIKDGFVNKPASTRKAIGAGRGRGWTYRSDSKKAYQVMAKGRYIGCFATQAEAEAAYQRAARGNPLLSEPNGPTTDWGDLN